MNKIDIDTKNIVKGGRDEKLKNRPTDGKNGNSSLLFSSLPFPYLPLSVPFLFFLFLSVNFPSPFPFPLLYPTCLRISGLERRPWRCVGWGASGYRWSARASTQSAGTRRSAPPGIGWPVIHDRVILVPCKQWLVYTYMCQTLFFCYSPDEVFGQRRIWSNKEIRRNLRGETKW